MKEKIYVLTQLQNLLTETIGLMISYTLDPIWEENPIEGFGVLRRLIDSAEKETVALNGHGKPAGNGAE